MKNSKIMRKTSVGLSQKLATKAPQITPALTKTPKIILNLIKKRAWNESFSFIVSINFSMFFIEWILAQKGKKCKN